MLTFTINSLSWLMRKVFGVKSRQKILYEQLHQLSLLGDGGKVQKFLIQHANDTFAAGFLFTEFLAMPELYEHLPEILKGANLCLDKDQGFFCNRWREHPECYRRRSSHAYQGNECYAIGHFLFWLDMEGNTRFQFENSPWRGLLHSIRHISDFLRYRRDNEQQGVTGTSAFTEEFCIRVEINLLDFLECTVN